MAIKGLFIGIDKYLDQDIRDLSGAKRDADVLWALFSDSIKELEPVLLTDEKASVEAIRNNLNNTLKLAKEDDTVIISFSCHGTNNHRFVAHNTSSKNLIDTTIPMSELADLFKESKAKRILLILDCCFSGGASAKVLENSPVERGPLYNYDILSGKGRLIITASSIDEPAYEFPETRHGVLTQSFVDVFMESENEMINVQEATSKIMEKVRIKTSSVGLKQTPTFLGHIEGGLILPKFKPGEKYYLTFPEKKGVIITKNIHDLSNSDFPEAVLDEWSKNFPNGLNELQLSSVNYKRILDGNSLLVVAPTSSGKTFIGEMASVKAILDGKKAVFLLPYKALVNEKYDYFQSLYGDIMGIRVVRCSGDFLDQTGAFVNGKFDLAILTYEMFLQLAITNNSILQQIGLVVLDEAQFITDPSRGIVVELLLTYLITNKSKGITPQIIALSAVIGDVNSFNDWLGSDKLITYKRPVPIIEGVMDRSGIFQYRNDSGEIGETQIINNIHQRKDKPSSQDIIVPLVKHLVSNGEKVIVFRNTRGIAQGCAKYLANELGLPPTIEVLKELPNQDVHLNSSELRHCLNGGTAFHSTDLTREERQAVEREFRDSNGKIRVLSATTTVAAGINTPASTVILVEHAFVGATGRDFTVSEYKNMSGRAGRLGFMEEGKSIILAENSSERQMLFNKYVLGELEKLHSSFNDSNLETWVVRLLSQIDQIPKDDVASLLANTYGGYLAQKNNLSWMNQMKAYINDLIDRMIELNLVEVEGNNAQLTLLGRACGESSLSFKSAIRFVEILKTYSNEITTGEKLMAIVQMLEESDNGYTPLMKKGRSESIRQNEAVVRYGSSVVRILQKFAKDEFDFLGRCKRASILLDWISGYPVGVIEKQYSTTPYGGYISYGDVRKFADATRFHLRSAHKIMLTMMLENCPSPEEIDNILKRLEYGLPLECLNLLNKSVQLTRGEYLELLNIGIKSLDDLLATSDDKLLKVITQDQIDSFKTLKEN